MKKYKHLLWLSSLVIILISLLSLNGCSLGGETIPKNRTKEQYEFEKTFESMFRFLEQDKKDFTGLKSYTSRVYIKNQDEVKKYEVDLDITKADIKGDYTITTRDTKETVPVNYSNGELNYGSETEKTEFREIIYRPEKNSDLYKHLKSKYDLPEETTCVVVVSHSSSTIYRATIHLKSNQKIVQISSIIFEKE